MFVQGIYYCNYHGCNLVIAPGESRAEVLVPGTAKNPVYLRFHDYDQKPCYKRYSSERNGRNYEPASP
jgi:hypothetical protein